LLLRGLGQEDVTDELRMRAAARARPAQAHTLAAEPLPALPPVSGPPRKLVVPPAPGIDPGELAAIAARAAARARKLLTEYTP
jgi:hypothetical protein